MIVFLKGFIYVYNLFLLCNYNRSTTIFYSCLFNNGNVQACMGHRQGPDVIGLSLSQFRKRPLIAQMEPGYLFIEMFGQTVNIDRIFLAEQLNLGEYLVGKAVAHNKLG